MCDGCSRWRLVLYRHPDRKDLWRCRRCFRLVYLSQRASRDWMYYAQLRIEALARRFVPGWEYADKFPAKPPRLRWRTWNRFCEAVSEWEEVRDGVFWRRVASLLRRVRS